MENALPTGGIDTDGTETGWYGVQGACGGEEIGGEESEADSSSEE
jgi:hypothetical protein